MNFSIIRNDISAFLFLDTEASETKFISRSLHHSVPFSLSLPFPPSLHSSLSPICPSLPPPLFFPSYLSFQMIKKKTKNKVSVEILFQNTSKSYLMVRKHVLSHVKGKSNSFTIIVMLKICFNIRD